MSSTAETSSESTLGEKLCQQQNQTPDLLQKQIKELQEENAKLKAALKAREVILDRQLDVIDDMSVCQDFDEEKANLALYFKNLMKANYIEKWEKSTKTSPLHIREYWIPTTRSCYSMTTLHTAAANATKPSSYFVSLLRLASSSHELDIPDLMGRSPLFYAARKMNFYTVEELLKKGASPHLLDYAGQNCVDFASMTLSSRKEDKENKQRMIALLIDAMKSIPISSEISQINEAIREMRFNHPFSSYAATLANCVVTEQRCFFALYCSKQVTDHGCMLTNPYYSTRTVEMSPKAKYSHYQFFEDGKVLLLVYELNDDLTKEQLEETVENAMKDTICQFHSEEEDPSFDYRKVAFFKKIHTECSSHGQCALHVLMQLLRTLAGHSVAFVFDNSQAGLAISADEDGEKLVYSNADVS